MSRNENVAAAIKLENAKKATEQVVAKAISSVVTGNKSKPVSPALLLANAEQRLIRSSELLEDSKDSIMGPNGAIELLARLEIAVEQFDE